MRALRLAIADDTFTRRWLAGTRIQACIHNVTGAVSSVAITGNNPKSGAALFDTHTALSDLMEEFQELERALQHNE